MRRIEPAVYKGRCRCFGDVRPAGTLVEVSALAVPDALAEIEAVDLLSRQGA